MTKSASLPHKPTSDKGENQHKEAKWGTDNRKAGSGDQLTTKNHRRFDFSQPTVPGMVDFASGFIGKAVHVIVKPDAQFQGTLSKLTVTENSKLEILLKNAGDVKENEMDLATRLETLSIKMDDLVDITPMEWTKGKNVFKKDQENTTQQYGHLRCRPTMEDEQSLELDRSNGSSDIPFQLATNERLAGSEAGTGEGLYSTNLDRSTIELKENGQSGNKTQQSPKRNGCTPEPLSWDDEDRYGTTDPRSTIENNKDNRTGHRHWKSPAKTHDSKSPSRSYRNQRGPHYHLNNYDQKNKQATNSWTANKKAKESDMLNKGPMNSRDTLNFRRDNNYTKSSTPRSNRNTSWPSGNSKNNRNKYGHRQWIRNDMGTSSNHPRHDYANDYTSTINNTKPATNHKNSASSSTPFKLNIMAPEFIPSGGVRSDEDKPKDITSSTSTTSTTSFSSTPQTPPLQHQEFVTVGEMFPAPFNKSGYTSPNNTEPLWPFGQVSYSSTYNITAYSDGDWENAQYQPLHQYPDYYPQHYPAHPCVPYYPHHYVQQYKHNPRNLPNMMHYPFASNSNMTGTGNQQSQSDLSTYQAYYY